MGGYYTEQELWFSALYGGAVYRKTGETGERLVPSADTDAGTGHSGEPSGGKNAGKRAETHSGKRAERNSGTNDRTGGGTGDRAGGGKGRRMFPGKRKSAAPDRAEAGGVSRGTAAGISLLPPSGISPILTNLTTGERVYLRLLPEGTDRADFLRRVLSPPSPDLALWPVDLLPLSAEQRSLCTLRAGHACAPESGGAEDSAPDSGKSDTPGRAGKPDTSGGSHAALAAVFPLSPPEGLRGGQEALGGCGPLSWKNPAARSLAVRLAEGLDRLNRDGWLYYDLHPSRLFFREDGQMFFDYSCLSAPVEESTDTIRRKTRPPEDTVSRRTGTRPPEGTNIIRPEHYPPEFADPAVMQGLIPQPDRRSQNYSLCALLFYVLFGRCPCDGTLLAGYPDDDAHNHYVKFRDYHRMPLFLFDPEDSRNTPGTFAEDENLTALWASCPEELRRLFTEALCRASAERRGGRVPGPPELLDCFRRLGWDRHLKNRRR